MNTSSQSTITALLRNDQACEKIAALTIALSGKGFTVLEVSSRYSEFGRVARLLFEADQEVDQTELQSLITHDLELNEHDCELRIAKQPLQVGVFFSANDRLLYYSLRQFTANGVSSSVANIEFVITDTPGLLSTAKRFGVPCFLVDSQMSGIEINVELQKLLLRYKPDVIVTSGFVTPSSFKTLTDINAFIFDVPGVSFPGDSTLSTTAPATGAGRAAVAVANLVSGNVNHEQVLWAECITLPEVTSPTQIESTTTALMFDVIRNLIEKHAQHKILLNPPSHYIFD